MDTPVDLSAQSEVLHYILYVRVKREEEIRKLYPGDYIRKIEDDDRGIVFCVESPIPVGL